MDLFSILDGTPEPPIVDLHLGAINASGEYRLATPMFDFQKELTDQIVSLHYSDILRYCETADPADLITRSLKICIENCMLVATHPYLLIRHYMPKNLALRDLPAKLAETSGKFSVLRNLLNVIVGTGSAAAKNVGVVMRNDAKWFDLTEALLLGGRSPKAVWRHVGNSVKKEGSKGRGPAADATTNIHLIPSDGVCTRKDLDLAAVDFDVLVLIDGDVDTDSDVVRRLRSQNKTGAAGAAVVISLVPMNSIEHCLFHYKPLAHDDSYLYKLISSIVCMRDQIGNLPPDLFPIYNQNLTFLQHTFFDAVFRRDPGFPAWPLPELPNIPRFSATDVERSLLTEVVYHYTPYDSADAMAGSVAPKKSYYELKRLQLDYVTNLLKNDYNILSGIHNHHSEPRDASILTHLLITNLGNTHVEYAAAMAELKCYRDFNLENKQRTFGRRLAEMNKTVSSIMEEVDHAEQRIQVAQKKILKRTQENDELSEIHERKRAALTNFCSANDIPEDSPKGQLIKRKLEVFGLKDEVKALVASLQLKADEKAYMVKEVSNCQESISLSQLQIETVQVALKADSIRLEKAREQEEADQREFELQKASILAQIAETEAKNAAAKAQLAKAFKYLRETSHLKKRKGRGVTPVAR